MVRGCKMKKHDGALAYRLLNNAYISESGGQLIRVALPKDLLRRSH